MISQTGAVVRIGRVNRAEAGRTLQHSVLRIAVSVRLRIG